MHAMIDFETAGLGPTALPLSIGIVLFDPSKYDVDPDPNSRVHIKFDHAWLEARGGFAKDADTVAWWSQQSQAAYEAAWEGERWDTFMAAGWIRGMLNRPDIQGVWGNGASFDNAVLRNLFGVLHRIEPSMPPEAYNYKRDRCYRTLRALFEERNPTYRTPMFEGTEHNALDDAIYQARIAQLMLRNLR